MRVSNHDSHAQASRKRKRQPHQAAASIERMARRQRNAQKTRTACSGDATQHGGMAARARIARNNGEAGENGMAAHQWRHVAAAKAASKRQKIGSKQRALLTASYRRRRSVSLCSTYSPVPVYSVSSLSNSSGKAKMAWQMKAAINRCRNQAKQ